MKFLFSFVMYVYINGFGAISMWFGLYSLDSSLSYLKEQIFGLFNCTSHLFDMTQTDDLGY